MELVLTISKKESTEYCLYPEIKKKCAEIRTKNLGMSIFKCTFLIVQGSMYPSIKIFIKKNDLETKRVRYLISCGK